jgi:quercetin dioxygenase-like cupin family protein
MSSETGSSTGRWEAPEPSVIAFGDSVEHDAGVRDHEHVFNGVRWALVEYAPGSGREGWCTQPHMGYVISGKLEYSFEDGRPSLQVSAGSGFALPPRPGHAGHNHGDEPARLFIIDALGATQADNRLGWAT